jgi:hypothetical protein
MQQYQKANVIENLKQKYPTVGHFLKLLFVRVSAAKQSFSNFFNNEMLNPLLLH